MSTRRSLCVSRHHESVWASIPSTYLLQKCSANRGGWGAGAKGGRSGQSGLRERLARAKGRRGLMRQNAFRKLHPLPPRRRFTWGRLRTGQVREEGHVRIRVRGPDGKLRPDVAEVLREADLRDYIPAVPDPPPQSNLGER